MKRLLFILLFLTAATGASAQTESKFSRWLTDFSHRLDSNAVRKVDTTYIEVPKRPWRVILRGKMNQADFRTQNESLLRVDDKEVPTSLDVNFNTKLGVATGLWVGYRGLGIGYNSKLLKNAGTSLNISKTGPKLGLNIRIQKLDIEDGDIFFEVTDRERTESISRREKGRFLTPLQTTSLYINGYYVLNSRRFSQAAVYNQSVIQRRSAGSLLVGATLFASEIDMSQLSNAGMVFLADRLGRIGLGQFSVGVGYGYNWVPVRGLTINVMAMPHISLRDRLTLVKYDGNYDFFGKESGPDTYGAWNKETRTWANGKSKKPLYIDDQAVDWQRDIDIWETESNKSTSYFRLNVDLRMGVCYCWNRYFVGANANMNYYYYGHKSNLVKLLEWYATFSLGMRF